MVCSCTVTLFVFVCFANKAYGNDQVEKIVDVEATADSLIVHTDAAGGTAGLRILIELYDLAANELRLRTVDLSGPILESTRGLYSLQSLQPSTWYGVSFKTEQTTSGSTRSAIDNRLARTLTANGTEDFPLYQVNTVTDSEQADEVQLNVKRVPIELEIELIVSAAIECDGILSTKQDIKLSGNQTKGTAQFQVSHTREIVPANDGSSRVTAVLTPGKCNRICWSPWLRYTTTKDYRTYSNKQNETCDPIEAVNITSGLRRVVSRTATDQSVTVNTIYNITGVPERDAYVTVSAYQLTRTNATSNMTSNMTLDQPEWLVRNFTVDWTSVNFTMDDLAPGQWYAVLYNYTTQTPFAYNDILRFITYTAALNDSDDEALLKMEVQVVKDRLNMTIARSDRLRGRPLTTRFLPFCGQNGSSVMLTDEQPEQQVDFDISVVRCLLFPDKCDKNANDSASIAALMGDDGDNVTNYDCEHLCYRCEIFAPPPLQFDHLQLPPEGENDLFTLDGQCFAMRDVFAKSNSAGKLSAFSHVIAVLSLTLHINIMLHLA